MDVQQITMDPAQAREAFKAYRAAVKRRYNADYDALAKGYKAIAQGKSVIDLHSALKAAGVDDRYRPKFAVARADWEWAHFQSDGNFWAFAKERWIRSACHTRTYVRVPKAVLPIPQSSDVRCKARVPMVPPMYQPRGSLGNYHILWEADWEDMPVDPILLRHLSGSLYAVLATWDLTDLERAVMRK